MVLTTSQTVEDLHREPLADHGTLTAQLRHPDAGTRRWAARDAVALRASSALTARLWEEKEPSVRKIILTSLTQIADSAAVMGLVECLRCEDAQLRCDAIEAIKSLPDSLAPAIHDLLADADPDVRIQAVNVLEAVCSPQVEAWLIEIIERDPVVNVCGAALNLLCEIGTSAATPALTRLRARFADDAYIGFATDLAMKRVAGD